MLLQQTAQQMHFGQRALHRAGLACAGNNHQRNGEKAKADAFTLRIHRRCEQARDALRTGWRLHGQCVADTGIITRLQRLLQRRTQRGIINLLCCLKQRVISG